MQVGSINNPCYQSPFNNMPVGIIGHGGMVDNEANINFWCMGKQRRVPCKS